MVAFPKSAEPRRTAEAAESDATPPANAGPAALGVALVWVGLGIVACALAGWAVFGTYTAATGFLVLIFTAREARRRARAQVTAQLTGTHQ